MIQGVDPISKYQHRHLSLLNYAAVVMACLWLVVLFFTLTPLINDFHDYWYGALNVVEKGDPYTTMIEHQRINITGQTEHIVPAQRSYIYPPFLAYVLQPLALLPQIVAQKIWFGINIIALGVLILQFFKMSPASIRQYWGIIILFIVILAPSRVTLQLGQISIILSVLIMASCMLAEQRPRLAGALLALAVLIKIYPALLALPYLLDRRRRAAFWWTLFCGVFLIGLSLLIHGPAPYINYLNKVVLLQHSYPYAAEFNISFMGFWSRLLSTNRYTIPLTDQPQLVTLLTLLCNLSLFGLAVWQSYRQQHKAMLVFGLWVCVTLLISPANGYYSLVSLIMPIAALLAHKAHEKQPGWSLYDLALLLVIALICVPPAWSNAVPWLYERLHIGWGTLFLTPSFYGLLLLILLINRVNKYGSVSN